MLFASMGSSLVAYFVVSRFMPAPNPVASAEMIRIVLFVLAGTAVFAATLFKPIYLRTVPATPDARLARLRTSAVLSAALAELPAILGFILFFVTGQRTEFYGMLVVSAYLLREAHSAARGVGKLRAPRQRQPLARALTGSEVPPCSTFAASRSSPSIVMEP